jgi:protein O-mannosyl-transferase
MAALLRHPLLHLLLIACAVAAAYAGAPGNGFTLDDGMLFLEVPAVQGFSAKNVATVFTSAPNGYEYLPVRDLTSMLDYALWGKADPWGFHLSQLAWYAAACAALYLFLSELLGPLSREPRLAALFATLLFALHPLHVEGAATLSQRKDLVAALFFFLSLHAFVLFRRKRRTPWYLLALAAAALSFLSKSTALALPAAVFLLDLLVIRGEGDGWARKAMRAVPFGLLALTALAANAHFLSSAPIRLLGLSAWGGGPLERTAMVLVTLSRDVALALFPWPLVPFRAVSLVPPGLFGVLLAAAGAALAGGAAWLAWLALRRPALAVPAWSAGLFLVALLPSLGFAYSMGMMADRYLFLPVAGLCLAAGWGAAEWWSALAGSVRALPLAALAVVLGLYGAATAAGVPVWRDPLSVFTQSFRYNGGDDWVARALANELLRRNQHDRALAVLREAAEKGADPSRTLLFTALVHYRKGDLPPALAIVKQVEAAVHGEFSDVHGLAGFVYKALGRAPEARAEFEASLAAPRPLLDRDLFTREEIEHALAFIARWK